MADLVHCCTAGADGDAEDPQPEAHKPLRALLAERAGADNTAAASQVCVGWTEQSAVLLAVLVLA